jgi:hypothetical protein
MEGPSGLLIDPLRGLKAPAKILLLDLNAYGFPIRTETTQVEKVPAKGSRTSSPGELTSSTSLSIKCRLALAGCLMSSLGKNLR